MTQLHRIVVSVSDLSRALGFYRDRLGLRALPGDGMATLSVGTGDVELFLHERASAPSDRSVALTFRVRNLDAVCANWAAADGVVLDPPADQPWGERMAVVRDADGHIVCLTDDRG